MTRVVAGDACPQLVGTYKATVPFTRATSGTTTFVRVSIGIAKIVSGH